jgi:hypothetical protein
MNETMSVNAKVAIVTALITAATTISTAFIGIVPKMRQADQVKIDSLSKDTSDLRTQLEELKKPSAERYTVNGRVRSKNNNAPVTGAVLYAATTADSVPLDDNGTFVFQNMLRGPYWIVVANQSGTIRRFLINPDQPETEGEEIAITYSFSKE